MIKRYNNTLDDLMQQFRDQTHRDVDTPPGVSRMSRFNALINPSAGQQKGLLHDTYLVILKEIMRRDLYSDDDEYREALAGFRSVMGQILGTAEPLSLNSLNMM
jgi:hypothetical protein